MSKLISLIFLSLFAISNEQLIDSDACKLSIEFTNVRNSDGVLYIFIYNYENQYPDNPYKHFKINKCAIRNDRLLVNIPNLDKGKYGISILDDENDNEDMDLFLGLPTEGYAFSNNVRPALSMPDYEDILIDLDEKHKKLRLKMRYVL